MHHLVFRDELGSTRSVPLDGTRPVTIGRDHERDVVLADRQVSRHHASIETVSGSFLLRDAGSVNGTFLNGLRLSGASAITLRDGDVIEIGHLRICFASDVAHAQESLAPSVASTRRFQESAVPYSDLLRDGLALVGGGAGGPDESSAQQVLAAFADAPLLTALRRTIELVDRKLDLDVAAIYLKQRARAPIELVASRPSALDPRSVAHEGFVRNVVDAALLYYRTGDDRFGSSLSDTCVGVREHSAAFVPFFRGANILGVVLIERFTGTRLDRKDAAIAAVYGERIARALSIRGASPNDTPVGVLGDVT